MPQLSRDSSLPDSEWVELARADCKSYANPVGAQSVHHVHVHYHCSHHHARLSSVFLSIQVLHPRRGEPPMLRHSVPFGLCQAYMDVKGFLAILWKNVGEDQGSW